MYLHLLKSIPTASVAKTITGFVAGGGAALIAKEIITNNIDEPETLIKKIRMTAGTVVVGMMVQSAVRDYTDGQIDQIANLITSTKEELRAKKNIEEPTE